MEGVPRIPMLSFPMRKNADTPHFKSRLKNFISNHYNEDSESYGTEIHELESLRASAVHISKDFSGCSTLKKYFCQLNFLKSRFPMNEGGSCAISFSWYDVFSDTVHGWSDVDFEMSCVLYNIGALHSELGALDNRQTADGMKTSCTHFQCAAWAFSHLRHNYHKFFTPDLSPDMLNILMNICLAQAQECILEKSLIDNRKSTITAKVSLQIVEYYSTALRTIDGMLKDAAQYSDKLVKAIKKWRKLVELKVQYYGCIAYLYRGMQAEDQGKWGERVTMYKAAAEKLNECIKLAKNMEKSDPVNDTIHFTLDVVGGKVAIAEKENEFIYHEKVPDLDSVMSDVKAVSLVKGIPFKFDDPQIAGSDIFGRLVPMEAHEASSVYSEEKAKILRNYSKKIEEKNESLDKFVIPLQLDQLDSHDSDKIPQELIDCCAALSVNQDAVKRLSELMAKLSSLFHDVEANLEEIHDHFAEQEKKENEYQELVGNRPPNNIINEITRELQKYQSAQAVAAESNKTLHEAMVVHVANLTILMKPLDEVMKHIPKYDELEKNEDALERMKKLAGKVTEMRKQREMFEGQLRDSILNDDITKSLVVKKGEDLETVFREELQKHDKITQNLDQNLLAQENIIRALTEANAEYAETRRATVELKKKRDKVILSYIDSYEAYDELISKCNKGIEFYVKLNSNVEKLLQRIKSVCKVQNEERETNMDRIIRKAQVPVPTPSNVGYGGVANYPSGFSPSIPTTYNISQSSTTAPLPSSTPRSSGGHLKLKDYLAMKKEGQAHTTGDVSTGTNMAGNTSSSGLPYHQDTPGQQLHYPIMSSTPPPRSPAVQHQIDTSFHSNYNRDSTTIGIRPAPVGSEDVGKDSACSYTYSNQANQHAYNSYIMPGPCPAPNSYYSGPGNASDAISNISSYGTSQYGHGFVSQPSAAPATYPQQQQIPVSSYQHGQTQHQINHTPVAPAAGSVMQTQVKYFDHQASTGMPAVSYVPNLPGYYPMSTMNTSSYSSPVYSSGQYPSGGAKPYEATNTSAAYSLAYGMPLTYSGTRYPTPSAIQPIDQQQQYSSVANVSPAPVAHSAPSLSLATPQPTAATAFYSPAFQPTANTSTNATYSTGTTATPSTAVPMFQQNQQPVQSDNPVIPQQQSSTVVSDDGSSYSQTSFLAQYVRQNQGYLSSTSTQPATNAFPSSVNYGTGTENSSSYPHQATGYSAGYGFSNQFSSTQSTGGNFASYSQKQTDQTPSTTVIQSHETLQQPQSYSQAAYPSQQPNYVHVQQNQLAATAQPVSQLPPTNYFSNMSDSQAHVRHGPVTQATSNQHPENQGPVATSFMAVVPTQPKPNVNSNLDLLSGIDFNVLPAVEPLAPTILPPAAVTDSSVPASDSFKNDQEKQVTSPTSPVASIPTILSTSLESVSSSTIFNLPVSNNTITSDSKGPIFVDPFQDPLALERFTLEVEKFENTVEGLSKQSLSGKENKLDSKWKELLEIQNATSVKRSISVARCYPMKNRFPDIMPYDQTRVPIPNTKDDYINASFIIGISPAAFPVIATQAPLPATMTDFWYMIWHHYIELIVCICSDSDLKDHVYWPQEKGVPLEYGVLKIILQTKNNKLHYIERIFTISHGNLNLSRVVIHLQFTGWTGHTFPVSPGPLISFAKEVASYYHQQRSLNHPVVVHCVSGVGKTGVFCVILSAIQEIDKGNGIPDLLQIVGTACEQRKGIMIDKEYFRFAFHSLLYCCQDILMKRGILSAKSTFEEKQKKSHIRHPSQDFLQDISLTKLIDKVNSVNNTASSSNKEGTPSYNANSNSVKSSPVKKPSSSSVYERGNVAKPKLSYSDVPESLTNIDPVTFRFNPNAGNSAVDDSSQYKKLAFESNKGALFDRNDEAIQDPLSSLDPLWTLNK